MAQLPHPAFPHFDLSVLTEQQREVVEMRYERGLSFGSIADLLSIAKGTVQSHHRRAMAKLIEATSYEQDLK